MLGSWGKRILTFQVEYCQCCYCGASAFSLAPVSQHVCVSHGPGTQPLPVAKVTINKHPSYVTWLGLSDNFQTRLFIISAMQLEYPTGESCYPTSQGGPESHRWRWLYVKEENSSCDCG